MHSLHDLADEQLTARLYGLRKQERDLLVDFLLALAELDRRKLYLQQGFPSLFAFCTDYLGLESSTTFRRVTAARLISRFPAIAEHLADGRLSLTTLCELRDVLDDESSQSVLSRAAGRTEAQVKLLVASLRPQPAPPDLLRRLPVRTAAAPAISANAAPGPQLVLTEASVLPASTAAPTHAEAASADPTQPVDTAAPAVSTASPAASQPARLAPISADAYVLRITVDHAFIADLDALRALLSHRLPGASPAVLLQEALRLARKALEARRAGTAKPAPARGTPPAAKPGTRHIPAAVRREVWIRDGARCAYVSPDGHRCDSTHQLELHHLTPFALGGATTAANLSLRCAAHNRYHAEQELGAEHIARKRAERS